MRIFYADGSFANAMIIRLAGGTLRAAVAGLDDAVEFTLFRDHWISENGEVVSFAFPLSMENAVYSDDAPLCAESAGHCAAGGDCVLRRIGETNLHGPVH